MSNLNNFQIVESTDSAIQVAGSGFAASFFDTAEKFSQKQEDTRAQVNQTIEDFDPEEVSPLLY